MVSWSTMVIIYKDVCGYMRFFCNSEDKQCYTSSAFCAGTKCRSTEGKEFSFVFLRVCAKERRLMMGGAVKEDEKEKGGPTEHWRKSSWLIKSRGVLFSSRWCMGIWVLARPRSRTNPLLRNGDLSNLIRFMFTVMGVPHHPLNWLSMWIENFAKLWSHQIVLFVAGGGTGWGRSKS